MQESGTYRYTENKTGKIKTWENYHPTFQLGVISLSSTKNLREKPRAIEFMLLGYSLSQYYKISNEWNNLTDEEITLLGFTSSQDSSEQFRCSLTEHATVH
jgi:hypothetical protein